MRSAIVFVVGFIAAFAGGYKISKEISNFIDDVMPTDEDRKDDDDD